MTTTDTERFRTILEDERKRVRMRSRTSTRRTLARSPTRRTKRPTRATTWATSRPQPSTGRWRARSRTTRRTSWSRSTPHFPHRGGDVRPVRALRPADRPGTPRGLPCATLCIDDKRKQERGYRPGSEAGVPPELTHSRSRADLRAARSLAPPRALGRPGRGRRGRDRRPPADEARRRSQLRLDEEAKVIGCSRSPCPELGDRLWPLRERYPARDRAHHDRRRLDDRLLRALRRPASALPAAVGLLIGGSIPNLADRVRLGHVTHFLDLRYWPAFNLADSSIVAAWRSCSGPSSRPTAGRGASVSRHRVPESASGERLDRFVAESVGSRGAAEG